MLEKLEVAHKEHFLSLELSQFLSHQLFIAFCRPRQRESKQLTYLQLDVLHLLVARVPLAIDPLLQLGDVIGIQVRLVRKLLKRVHIFHRQLYVWLSNQAFKIDIIILSSRSCLILIIFELMLLLDYHLVMLHFKLTECDQVVAIALLI